jgi:hypothetical protein
MEPRDQTFTGLSEVFLKILKKELLIYGNFQEARPILLKSIS